MAILRRIKFHTALGFGLLATAVLFGAFMASGKLHVQAAKAPGKVLAATATKANLSFSTSGEKQIRNRLYTYTITADNFSYYPGKDDTDLDEGYLFTVKGSVLNCTLKRRSCTKAVSGRVYEYEGEDQETSKEPHDRDDGELIAQLRSGKFSTTRSISAGGNVSYTIFVKASNRYYEVGTLWFELPESSEQPQPAYGYANIKSPYPEQSVHGSELTVEAQVSRPDGIAYIKTYIGGAEYPHSNIGSIMDNDPYRRNARYMIKVPFGTLPQGRHIFMLSTWDNKGVRLDSQVSFHYGQQPSAVYGYHNPFSNFTANVGEPHVGIAGGYYNPGSTAVYISQIALRVPEPNTTADVLIDFRAYYNGVEISSAPSSYTTNPRLVMFTVNQTAAAYSQNTIYFVANVKSGISPQTISNIGLYKIYGSNGATLNVSGLPANQVMYIQNSPSYGYTQTTFGNRHSNVYDTSVFRYSGALPYKASVNCGINGNFDCAQEVHAIYGIAGDNTTKYIKSLTYTFDSCQGKQFTQMRLLEYNDAFNPTVKKLVAQSGGPSNNQIKFTNLNIELKPRYSGGQYNPWKGIVLAADLPDCSGVYNTTLSQIVLADGSSFDYYTHPQNLTVNGTTQSSQPHPAGTNVNIDGTIYMVTAEKCLRGYVSVAAFTSRGFTFQDVVPSNAADRALPICSGPPFDVQASLNISFQPNSAYAGLSVVENSGNNRIDSLTMTSNFDGSLSGISFDVGGPCKGHTLRDFTLKYNGQTFTNPRFDFLSEGQYQVSFSLSPQAFVKGHLYTIELWANVGVCQSSSSEKSYTSRMNGYGSAPLVPVGGTTYPGTRSVKVVSQAVTPQIKITEPLAGVSPTVYTSAHFFGNYQVIATAINNGNGLVQACYLEKYGSRLGKIDDVKKDSAGRILWHPGVYVQTTGIYSQKRFAYGAGFTLVCELKNTSGQVVASHTYGTFSVDLPTNGNFNASLKPAQNLNLINVPAKPSVGILWTDPTHDPNLGGYVIYRRASNFAVTGAEGDAMLILPYIPGGTDPVEMQAYEDYTVSKNTTYYYTVITVDKQGRYSSPPATKTIYTQSQ
ncbi:MAG TPA: hypothetical protein VEA59_02245 [Patescibacteria group bacterium]|nr:hypothetical protein [Patescibacteria group bacterium]